MSLLLLFTVPQTHPALAQTPAPHAVAALTCVSLTTRAPIHGLYWLSRPLSRLVLYPNMGQAGNDTTDDWPGALPVDAAYYVGAGPVRLPDLWHIAVETSADHTLANGPSLDLTPPARTHGRPKG